MVGRKNRTDIDTRTMAANESSGIRPIRFDHVPRGATVDEVARLIGLGKLENRSRRKSKLTQNSLGISAVILQPGPIPTAANDV